jgi:hypothetical protein
MKIHPRATSAPTVPKFYTIENFANRRMEQYTLSTPFDITTAQTPPAEITSPSGFFDFMRTFRFSNDGTKLFIGYDRQSGGITQYSLSTAWDIGSASYDSVSFSSFQGSNGTLKGMEFDSSGNTMYLYENSTQRIHAYNLNSPFDISSVTNGGQSSELAVYNGTFIRLVDDGNKVIICENVNPGVIHEHTLSSAYDLTTINPTPVASLSLAGSVDRAVGVSFSPNLDNMYVADRDGNNENDSKIVQFTR